MNGKLHFFFNYYSAIKTLDHCDLCILYTGSEKKNGFHVRVMLWLINYKYINNYTISSKQIKNKTFYILQLNLSIKTL